MALQLHNTCPTIDSNILEGYRALQAEGEPDIVTELIDMFLADLPSRTAVLRHAIELGDAVAAQRAAHALKGAAATLGATALAGICDFIEATTRTGAITAAAELLDEVDAETRRCSAALEKYRRA